MTRIIAIFLPVIALAGCFEDETVTGYGAANRTWVLESIDKTPFPARATLEFPEPGRIAGQAPCNRYSAEQSAPYPWFSAQKIAATRRACPELNSETRFLAALGDMTLSEVLEDTLILSTGDGREMVFKAAP